METLKIIFNTKGTWNTIINNVILFVLAYISVFFIMQIGLALAAFTFGVPIMIHTSYINFDVVNTAASQSVWESPDNVINIFGSPVLALIILLMISVLLLTTWRTEKLKIKKFLFWVVICCFVRIGGNYLAGQLFYLWNINLVTDFLGLTYPSKLGRLLFLVFVSIVILLLFFWATSLVQHIFNPFRGCIKEDYLINVLIPAIIGGVIVNLFFIQISPVFVETEIFGVLILWVGLAAVILPTMLNRYSFVDEMEFTYKEETIQRKFAIGLAVALIIVKVIFDGGVFLKPSPYRHYFLENSITIGLCIILGLFALYLFISYRHKNAKRIKAINENKKVQAEVSNVFSEADFGV